MFIPLGARKMTKNREAPGGSWIGGHQFRSTDVSKFEVFGLGLLVPTARRTKSPCRSRILTFKIKHPYFKFLLQFRTLHKQLHKYAHRAPYHQGPFLVGDQFMSK